MKLELADDIPFVNICHFAIQHGYELESTPNGELKMVPMTNNPALIPAAQPHTTNKHWMTR